MMHNGLTETIIPPGSFADFRGIFLFMDWFHLQYAVAAI